MTATSTTVHDSAICTLGADGGHCEMCAWANEQRLTDLQRAVMEHDNDMARLDRSRLEQSTATIHARRRALLERATPDAPADGAVALAHAYLADETWFQRLPDNAAEDAEVLALAAVIEEAVAMRLRLREREYQHEQRRLRDDG
jgi:hypothetical protein